MSLDKQTLGWLTFTFGGLKDRRFLVVNAHTDRLKIERAFAAELLAPAEGLRAALESTSEMVSDEDIERLARQYKVSPMVIGHQLRNQLHLEPAEY